MLRSSYDCDEWTVANMSVQLAVVTFSKPIRLKINHIVSITGLAILSLLLDILRKIQSVQDSWSRTKTSSHKCTESIWNGSQERWNWAHSLGMQSTKAISIETTFLSGFGYAHCDNRLSLLNREAWLSRWGGGSMCPLLLCRRELFYSYPWLLWMRCFNRGRMRAICTAPADGEYRLRKYTF